MKNLSLLLIILLLVGCTAENEVVYTQNISFTVAENEVNIGMNQLGNLLLTLPLDSILKANNSDIAHLNKMQLISATLNANDTNLNKKEITEFRIDIAGDLANNQPGKPFTLASTKEVSASTQLKTFDTDISDMYSGRAIYLLPIGTFTKNQPAPFSMQLKLQWKMVLGQINK
jgi:hypothetical protein